MRSIKYVLICATIALALVAGFVFWIVPPKPPPLVRLEGWEELLDLAPTTLNTSRWFGDYETEDEIPTEKIRDFVSQYRPTLDRVRAAVRRQRIVPVNEPQLATGTSTLIYLVGYDVHLARRERRYADALESGLDMVRLGFQWGYGGSSTDAVIGAAGISIGLDRLATFREELDAEQSRVLVRQLESLRRFFESPDEIEAREPAFLLRDDMTILERFERYWELKFSSNRSDYSRRVQALYELFLTDVAISMYRREQGTLPKGLSVLVPKYMSRLPLDPFSGTPFRYRVAEGGHVLYSVGPDGRDDGGLPMGWRAMERGERGDAFLDSEE